MTTRTPVVSVRAEIAVAAVWDDFSVERTAKAPRNLVSRLDGEGLDGEAARAIKCLRSADCHQKNQVIFKKKLQLPHQALDPSLKVRQTVVIIM